MAIDAHSNTTRKGDGSPYIAHPFAVMAFLQHWKASEDVCIAGLLHDVIEDAQEDKKSYYQKQILDCFGPSVLSIVEGVTEQDKTSEWIVRKKKYIEHLKTAPEGSLYVCCADKTHNLFCMLQGYEKQGKSFWERFNAPADQKLWFYEEAAKVIKKRMPIGIIDEMEMYLSLLQSEL